MSNPVPEIGFDDHHQKGIERGILVRDPRIFPFNRLMRTARFDLLCIKGVIKYIPTPEGAYYPVVQEGHDGEVDPVSEVYRGT